MYRSLKSLLRASALWILILPSAVTFLGISSNQLVLFANHDTFPVKENIVKFMADAKSRPALMELNAKAWEANPSAPVMLDDVHCLMTGKTHLNLLADIFDFQSEGIMSLGDLLLDLGSWLGTFCFYVWATVIISRVRVRSDG
jgi:hypothetical protein